MRGIVEIPPIFTGMFGLMHRWVDVL